MCDTTEVSINDMQVKVNMLVAELEKTLPFISQAIVSSPKMFDDGMRLLDRIEKLSQWSE